MSTASAADVEADDLVLAAADEALLAEARHLSTILCCACAEDIDEWRHEADDAAEDDADIFAAARGSPPPARHGPRLRRPSPLLLERDRITTIPAAQHPRNLLVEARRQGNDHHDNPHHYSSLSSSNTPRAADSSALVPPLSTPSPLDHRAARSHGSRLRLVPTAVQAAPEARAAREADATTTTTTAAAASGGDWMSDVEDDDASSSTGVQTATTCRACGSTRISSSKREWPPPPPPPASASPHEPQQEQELESLLGAVPRRPARLAARAAAGGTTAEGRSHAAHRAHRNRRAPRGRVLSCRPSGGPIPSGYDGQRQRRLVFLHEACSCCCGGPGGGS